MNDWQRRSQRVTIILLVASATLIIPGFAGVGASLALAAVLVLFAGALWQLRDELETLPTVAGYDLGWYTKESWAGPIVGAVIVLAMLDASPPELRALGGLAGFVGMVNYFVRPLYLYVFGHLRQLVSSQRAS